MTMGLGNYVATLIIILIAIFGVLLLVLEMANYWGSDWTTVGQEMGHLILFLAFFAMVLGMIGVYIRSR